MPNLPIRGLGTIGVITDAPNYSLPTEAWSNARNVRFSGDQVSRSSVFKPFALAQDFTTSDPILVVDDSLKSSTKAITTLRADGTITRITEGLIHNVTPTVPWATILGNPTSCIVGSVSYINTPNNVPIAYAHGEARYEPLPNWVSSDRCLALRKYRDFLIALNITKNGIEFPNMVKWSDGIMSGTRPGWDPSLDNTLAGENVLNDSTGYIVDGLELGNSFMIYGTKEAWRMSYIGGDLIFSVDKVFNDFRIMTQNCVVEVGSKHYVFCEDDIVVTDGMTFESICDNKVRAGIFKLIDFGKRGNCRVIHNSLKNEILFCYASLSSDAVVGASMTGCNEAAVFNYVNNTWSFIDLPNVTSACEANHPAGASEEGKTWAGLATWNQLKINWSFLTASPMTLIMASAENPDTGKKGNVFFYDDDQGGRVANPADPDTFYPAWAETRLVDFDSTGLPLEALKLFDSIVPQVTTTDSEQYVNFYIVGDMSPRSATDWPDPMPFYPETMYKLNTRVTGRYLSFRFEIPTGTAAELSGFDLSLTKIAGR